jgi:hypothetical protein
MAFTMKYTNGRKASPSSFPFKNPGIVGGVTHPGDSPLEQWDWSSAGGGAATGAKAGAVLGPWGAVAGAVVGGIWGGIAGGKAKDREEERIKQEQRLEAERQKEAERVEAVNADTAYREQIGAAKKPRKGGYRY